MCNEPFCPGRLKVALFYLSSLAPKFFTPKSRVVKQRFFQSLGTIWPPCEKRHIDWKSALKLVNLPSLKVIRSAKLEILQTFVW